LSSRPDAGEFLAQRPLGAPRARHAAHGAQPLHHVAQRRHVREEVELLEDHADPLAHPAISSRSR
jgi:hypothetical protein